MRFFIYAPPYDENSGGCIVLHRLVHLINEETKHQAFLVPRKLEKLDITSVQSFLYSLRVYFVRKRDSLKLKKNNNWNTPIITKLGKDDLEQGVIIYTDVTYGNPLKAKNIVRWLLHQPGHFTGEINYNVGEFFVKFNSAIKDFIFYNSKLSESELKVIYYPIDYYNSDDLPLNKNGECHLIRKGKNKKIIHSDDSVSIDGLSHTEIAKILKRSKLFISYDDYTAYSIFAVLCGCESIIVPSNNISIEQWYPDDKDRYGLSYGFSREQRLWAENTKDFVGKHVTNEHDKSISNIKKFINNVDEFFFNG